MSKIVVRNPLILGGCPHPPEVPVGDHDGSLNLILPEVSKNLY